MNKPKVYTKKTNMLAFDTSVKSTGWSLYVNGVLSDHGIVKRTGSATGADEMMVKLHEFIKGKKPDIIVVEMTVVVRNATTQRELTELIGAIRSQCLVNGIDFFRIRPSEWRKYIRDKDEKLPKDRNGLKFWSICKVKELFGIEVSDDEADAILIGEAYIRMCRQLLKE